MLKSRRRLILVPLLLIASTLATAGAAPAQADAPTAFTFGAAGDIGANSNSAATLTTLAGSGTDLFFAVGDLSYNEVTPESAWCNFVTSKVGSGYPFELVSGNHEDNGPDGLIQNYAACLPDRVGGVSGSYGKEYFVDYPAAAPLARFIMISPALSFPGESQYTYTKGNAHYTWLANAIDAARASGIRWVIVGMHEVCLDAGSMSCTIGTDLLNLLVGKKVDLVLQGHEHTYQRSKQLALGTACTAVTPGSFKAGCVVDDGADGVYSQGAGPVIVIAGTGGESLSSASPSDSDGPYFAKLMGGNSNPTDGFVRYQVSADKISAQFVRSARGTFTDSFTITSAGVNNRPTASAASATTTAGNPVAVTLAGSDVETCELGFNVTVTTQHGLLSAVNDQPCTPAPNRDTAVVTYTPDAGFTGTDTFTYQVSDGTSTSDPATATVTVNPAGGGGGGGGGITFHGASSGQNPTSTTLSLARPAGATAGDVMLAAVTLRGSATITAPPGWTLVRRDDANYVLQAVYVGVAGAGDPSSWTWGFSGSVPAAGGILDYAGVNTSAPVDVHGGQVTTGATTTITAPSITTTTAGDEIIGLFGIGGGNAISPPAGMVERAEAVSSAGSLHDTWEGSDFSQAAAGATGTKTAQATVAHPSVGQIVALRPA
jgi:hypothetical protein